MTIIDDVLQLKEEHKNTWRKKSNKFWYARMWEEFLELGFSLNGLHDHTPDSELIQLAAICLNWLEKRDDDNRME